MMYLVRMLAETADGSKIGDKFDSDAKGRVIWNYILDHKEELQEALRGRGRLLYLTRFFQQPGRGDVSLCFHLTDATVLPFFIAGHLTKIKGVTSLRLINLLAPVFSPLPKDTRGLRRYIVNIDVAPSYSESAYDRLVAMGLGEKVMKSYVAYKFSTFGSSIQYSVLARNDEDVRSSMENVRRSVTGVRGAECFEVQATRPLISYDEWIEYSGQYSIVPSWDDDRMVMNFQELETDPH
jgi:hypothetical protein